MNLALENKEFQMVNCLESARNLQVFFLLLKQSIWRFLVDLILLDNRGLVRQFFRGQRTAHQGEKAAACRCLLRRKAGKHNGRLEKPAATS